MIEQQSLTEELDELREQIQQLEKEQERLRGELIAAPALQAPAAEAPRKQPRSKAIPLAILAILLCALATGGYYLIRHLNTYETTDDAQIDGHLNAVSARIEGTLTSIRFLDNQVVKAGDLLAEIDSREYDVEVAQARAALAKTRAEERVESPSVPITETSNKTTVSSAEADVLGAQAAVASAESDYAAASAKIHEAEANAAKAQADLARYKTLVDNDEISHQAYDQAVAAAKASAATVESNRAAAAASDRVVAQRRAQLARVQGILSEANVNGPRQLNIRMANVAVRGASAAAAQARLDRALLNLSYCKIYAPVSGIVTKKNAEVGQRVSPGQQLLLLAQGGDLWVTANFKETQLDRIRSGQRATVQVDALDRTFSGHVDSLSGATGARTSLLPPENATGNYVKVVQRLPVRVLFDPNQSGLERLRVGMSVEAKVHLEP